MTAIDIPGYRACVGMMLFNSDGLVFTAQRCDTPGEAWQMPQGGVDEGESLEQAAMRELKEEIGTAEVRILDRTEQPLLYDLPEELQGKVWGGHYRGQAQHWFAMRYLGRDCDIDLSGPPREFEAWRWTPLGELPRLIVPFKRPVYERLVERFGYLARRTESHPGHAG